MDTLEALGQVRGNVYSTETFGTVDGPGVRYVLFLQGCPLHCLYCHNPGSIPFQGGTVWTAQQVVDEILRYLPYIKGGGVTFSGGEPLFQPEFIRAISLLLKKHHVHVAIDTAGSMNPAFVHDAIDVADLIILDIKSIDPDISRKLSGKTSDFAFATLDYCEKNQIPVWIRQVLLQGYTLEESQLKALAQRLAPYHCIELIELLPFHKLGEPNWEKLTSTYTLSETPATTKEEVEWAKSFFLEQGFTVQ